MAKQNLNSYDVIYRTKSGRGMIAKNVSAKTAEEAKKKITKEMRSSSTFAGVSMAIKIK